MGFEYKMTAIPSVSVNLNYDDINQIIIRNYSFFTKEYTTFLSEWLTDTNKIFNEFCKLIIRY